MPVRHQEDEKRLRRLRKIEADARTRQQEIRKSPSLRERLTDYALTARSMVRGRSGPKARELQVLDKTIENAERQRRRIRKKRGK